MLQIRKSCSASTVFPSFDCSYQFGLFSVNYLLLLKFHNFRFGKIEDTDSCAVYTLSNPTGLAKKQKSFLQKWIPESGELINVCTFDESLSALAVRDDGRFVAVGSMFSGSVSIHASFSLQVGNLLQLLCFI